MSINLRRFVNINVSRIKRNVVNPVRDTVAVYGAAIDIPNVLTDTVFTSGEYRYDKNGKVTGYALNGYDFASGDKIAELVIEDDDFVTNKFYVLASNFFNNGGAKMHVYIGTASVVSSKIKVGDLFIPVEEIAVAGINITADAMNVLAHSYNIAANPGAGSTDSNLGTSASKVFVTWTQAQGAIVTNPEENLAVKYGTEGIEGTILAYLSRINAYGENTVHDYAFTVENVPSANVIDDDATVAACMDAFVNVDAYLSKAVRNVGGDLITGQDLVNYYVTIIMQQTIEEVVINALSDKLSGAEGTAAIYNVVVSELNKYVRCGLLSAGNWEPIDWTVEYENETYVVANANERLALGYKLLVIPFSAMPQEQVAAHACPPIYVAMTNAYGIRKVVIKGEVR